MKKFRLRTFYLSIVTFVILIYMEVIFRLLTNINVFSISIVYILIFNLFITVLFNLIGKLFDKNVNKILFLIMLFLVGFLYSVQLCVFKMFGFYFDWTLIGASGQIASFAGDGVDLVIQNIFGVTLFFMPFILYLVYNRVIVIEKGNWKNNLIKIGLSILIGLSFLGVININKDKVNSPYKLYFNVNNIDLNVRTFGVLNTFLIDSYRNVIGFQEVLNIPNKPKDDKNNSDKDNIKEYKYNNLDIDFDNLINNENNKVIKTMHEYFNNEEGTKQNEYTDYFKGKNLILFMAESFNEIAVREDLTPTLYKLVNSGFVFNNFYTPTISSTIGGEFQELTGLVAASGFLGPWKSGNNYFPFGIGKVFKDMDYNTFAYHDHSVYFQNRYIYLKSLGFDNFKGCFNGLEKSINCKIWPESDVEMIDATIDDYINSDKPFFTYYVTVSGHGGYTFSSSAMAKKHMNEVKDLNISEKPKAYLAAQIELDRALEDLIKKLDEAGKLDDTVIALVGDHYPYYLSVDEVNEIADYEKDGIIEINRSNFILWNNKMDIVTVDKVGSEIDVLPTLYNLFGVKYDSRLIIGKDILSTEPGLAIFGNRSWVSDKGSYFSQKNKFVPKDNVSVDDDYISYMNTLVNNRMSMSKNIMANDYYKKVLGD